MNSPVLVLIDIQKEYVTQGRPFFIESIGPSLQNCRTILDHARKKQWKIVHVRHFSSQGEIFNASNEYSGFVEGFEPILNEIEINKAVPSCYSSDKFKTIMDDNKDNDIIIIGYGSTMCCLSTIIEGYHRKQKVIFVKDASAAKKGMKFSEKDTHESVCDVVNIYSKVLTTQQLLE
jgi:ureidoacrylate peracid hydrolase